MKKALAAHGLALCSGCEFEVGYSATNVPQQLDDATEINAAIQNCKSRPGGPCTHMLFLGSAAQRIPIFFMDGAERQAYRPLLGFSPIDEWTFIRNFLGPTTDPQFSQSKVVTWRPTDLGGTRRCVRALQEDLRSSGGDVQRGRGGRQGVDDLRILRYRQVLRGGGEGGGPEPVAVVVDQGREHDGARPAGRRLSHADDVHPPRRRRSDPRRRVVGRVSLLQAGFGRHPRSPEALEELLARAERAEARDLPLDADARASLIRMADGDGRAALSLAEEVWRAAGKDEIFGQERLQEVLQRRAPIYDKSQDGHYNLISALHKSVRGSDPQAALYYFCRILDGGEDPMYLARRLIRMAVEDIGLADHNALTVCNSAPRRLPHARHAGGGAGASRSRRLSRHRTEIERPLHGVQIGHARRQGRRLAAAAETHFERADPS